MQEETKSGMQRFAELFGTGDYDYSQPKPGDVVEAVILKKTDRDIIVDLGTKRSGIVLPRDLTQVPPEYLASLEPGDTIPVVVLRRWLSEDGVRVSLSRGLAQEDWLRAQELQETGELVEALVIGTNRGGILVQFGRIQGFVPNSHLGRLPSAHRGDQLPEAKEDLIGEVLHLAILEVEPRRRRLVMSKRAADRRRRSEAIKSVQPDQVRTGIVRSLVDYGAFVDIGGVDGLLHISEMSWKHIRHPRELLKVGDEIEVSVLSVDLDRQRISLSRKRLLPDPWTELLVTLQVGDHVEGTVTHTVDFGLFVSVGHGVEGLVHSSRIPPMLVNTQRDDRVLVEVLDIDPDRKRIGLALLTRLQDEPEEQPVEAAPVDDDTVDDDTVDDDTVDTLTDDRPFELETADDLAVSDVA